MATKFTYKNEVGRKWDVGSGTRPTQKQLLKKKKKKKICGPILGIYNSLTDTDTDNVKIGTEAAQLPEKEYINGIFIAM